MGRWRRFGRRVALACLAALVLALAPCPVWTPGTLIAWQVPVVIVMLVCYLGAALVDTLFYDRYF
jgi:hypothetical protein